MNELVPLDNELATALSEEQVAELFADLQAAVVAMEAPIAKLREMAGPQPGTVAANMLTMLNMGTGYYRHVRDSIARAYRARNSLCR